MTRKRGDGLRICACGRAKHPGGLRCSECYHRRWVSDEDTTLRQLIARGYEYKLIGRALGRSADACRSRAFFLGVKLDRAAILENRKRGRNRFYGNAAKVSRRMKRMMKQFTPFDRAIRAEELRQRNKAGTMGMKGKHHTPEVCQRIREAHLGRVMSAETRRKISEARKAYWAAKRDGGQAAYRQAMMADNARRRSFETEDDAPRIWCAQCELQVTAARANACASPFCKAKAIAA